ncbi:MAG: asparagine synthase (glutamine-hydrolyzing) [Rhodospirillaceae bacterium]
MCGIAGGMTTNGAVPLDSVLTSLQTSLRHRGPDGSGRHTADAVGLVHTRLAIIDPAHGAQPFVSEQGVAVIANGEIYNDLEIRQTLASQTYRTQSDNESILHAYLSEGVAYTSLLRGMFAVAVYDPRSRTLILSRDPFGIKPLYYTETPTGFWFASEAQALVKAGLLAATENTTARDELLALQFSNSDETALAGIRRVPPGTTLLVRNGKILDRIQTDAIARQAEASGDAASEFEALLFDSVRVHLRSDVPYGIFLSGGLDSAAVLTAMAEFEEQPVIAYTAGFANSSVHDERTQAALVAAATGADHRPIEISESDFWNTLPAIAACLDDPVADYAAIPTYHLAKAASQDVKVVLTGEGGAEVLGGYGRYRSGQRPWPFRKAPWARHALARVNVLRSSSKTWRSAIVAQENDIEAQPWSRLQKLQGLDIATWLPNDLLTKVDRCLMAHGVEGRVPFLDRSFASFAFHLKDNEKISGRLGKNILRQWLAEKMPISQPFARKRGFSVPVGGWIQSYGKVLGPLVADQPGVVRICEPSRVTDLFKSINTRTAFSAWVLLFYALWHQCHILGIGHAGSVAEVLAES